ncbi:hypothetical protein CONPUDRAFT_165715 [Coniophora puteana RWD-64-598 SS2]|uniref:Uncharacterized protein n=1 Tax=Coniophora puteana (strain RWD-64-598) TaxID=741705 RepID=A0A5M3MRC6_CONPW|nr:uncharacterized protein CONPUDRAFT_165715 [Coniophora puteana RWD-64-598 SS2]EIW81626.1 hypothetical protein CONPUDRAFT_165715 [Coniophora puteana RWD-64-598 SS2]
MTTVWRVSPFTAPAEVLEAIFEECAAQAHDYVHGGRDWPFYECTGSCLMDWIHVTQVCAYWRIVALAHRRLWSHVVFFNPRWAREMIDRAGPIPLTVSARIHWIPFAEELITLLVKNVGRVQDLRFQGDMMALRHIMEALAPGREVNRRFDIVKLHSLALLSVDGVPFAPRGFALDHTDGLKRLYLSAANLVSAKVQPSCVLQNAVELRELTLDDCLRWSPGMENDIYRFPHLTHLHLTDSEGNYAELLGQSELPPLQYFALESDLLDIDHLRPLADVNLVTPDGDAKIYEMNAHHCALRISLGMEEDPHVPQFSLTAWLQGTADPDQVTAFAHDSKIPPLPFGIPPEKRLGAIASFRSTITAMLISGGITGENEEDLDSRSLGELAVAFDLTTVIFANISNGVSGNQREHLQSMITFLAEARLIRVLELDNVLPIAFVIPLTPMNERGFVPAPQLKELWLTNIRFQAEGGEEDPTETLTILVDCLRARAQAGAMLEKLVLKDCIGITADDLASLKNTGVDVDVIVSPPNVEEEGGDEDDDTELSIDALRRLGFHLA